MHPVFNPVAPYRYLLPNLYLFVADIANPDMFAYGSRTWICLDIARFYEEHCQPSSGSARPACQKNVNRAPIVGGGRGRHNFHRFCQTTVTAPPRVCCVVWSLLTALIRAIHPLQAEGKKAFLKETQILLQICVKGMELLSITTHIRATHLLLQNNPKQQTEHTARLPTPSWYIGTHKEQLQRLLQSRPLSYKITLTS